MMETKHYHTTQPNPANLTLINIRDLPDFGLRLRQVRHLAISGESGCGRICGGIPAFVRILTQLQATRDGTGSPGQ